MHWKLVTFFVLAAFGAIVVSARRIPRQVSTDIYSGSVSAKLKNSLLAKVNIDQYLKNKRAMQLQIKCVIYNGACDLVGREVKKFIVVGLTGNCPDCDPRIKGKITRIVDHIIDNYPNAWRDAIFNYLVAPTLNRDRATTEASRIESNDELDKDLQELEEVQTTSIPEDEGSVDSEDTNITSSTSSPAEPQLPQSQSTQNATGSS